jgi:hypothetical protein
VQVTAHTPHITERLLVVSMAELLAVVKCVRPFWALYASTLMTIWQGIVSLNTSWDLDALGTIVRKRGMFIR